MPRPLRAAGAAGGRTDGQPYAVLDVETNGLRGELVFWTVRCEHGATGEGRTAGELWRLVLSHNSHGHSWREHVWWAHNGGAYDYLYLLPPARDDVFAGRVVVTPITRQDAVIGWRVSQGTRGHSHRTDLRDSYALLPSPLRALADQLAPDVPKLDIGLAAGVIFDPTNDTHREYANRDSEALLAVLVAFRAILSRRFGVLPSWSAASTALRAWRSTLPADAEWRGPIGPAAAYARAGYFGGMVRVGTTAWRAAHVTLDRNSMYPAVMRDGVPDGDPVFVTRFVPGRPAFYRVNADVPAGAPWTILAYRDLSGAIAWPTGRFTTTCTSAELEWARAHGQRVDVIDGWVWPALAFPFERFVAEYAGMRAMGGAFSTAAKFVGNGLYGKFGAKPLHDDWCLSAAQPGPDWFPPAYDSADDEAFERYRGLWVRLGQPLHADYLMPHWAAWITAGARIALAQMAEACGFDAVAYTDTDSVIVPAELVDRLPAALIGPALGQWKVDRSWHTFRALAPKVYEGVLDSGDRFRKAKGIPRRVDPRRGDLSGGSLVDTAFESPGTPVAWDSPNGSLAVLAGAPMTTPRTRRLSSIAGSVAWRLRDDGTVRPIHLGGIVPGPAP